MGEKRKTGKACLPQIFKLEILNIKKKHLNVNELKYLKQNN